MKKQLLSTLVLLFTVSYLIGQTTIYEQDFENGFPAEFSQQTSAADSGWLVGTANQLRSQSFPIIDQGSGQIIATNDDACNCDKSNDFLMTDSIDLTGYSGNTIFLRFDKFYFNASYQGDQESATVEVSTDGGNNWNVVKNLEGGLWSRESVDLTTYGGQHIMIGFRYNDRGGWLYGMAIDNLVVEVPNDYDFEMVEINSPRYHKISEGSIDLDATVFNNGGETITSFDMNYVIGNDTTTDNITGASISPLTDYSFHVPTSFDPPSTGEYTIRAFATNLNGNADQMQMNDTASTKTLVYDTAYQRAPLYEVFTSSTCGPCAPGNENFESIMSNYPNEAVTVKFQQDFPGNGDPYATDESVSRRGYYQINSVPRMEIDGGWDRNAQSFTSTLHEDAYGKPAFVNIKGEYKIWPDSQKVEVCYDIEGLKQYMGKNFYVAINENKTTENVGTNGETEFFNVFKKWMPNSGSSVDIEVGEITNGCMSYTFNGDYRLPANANDPINHTSEHSVEEFTDLNVALWVQDDNSLEVYQATYASKIDTQESYSVGPKEPTGIARIEEDAFQVELFPNPAKDQVTINYGKTSVSTVAFSIVNIEGRIIKHIGERAVNKDGGNFTIGISELSSGSYFVKMRSNSSVQYKKLIIQQ